MELEKFISESLKSIINGVNEAKEFANDKGAVINPHVGEWDLKVKSVPPVFLTQYIGNEEGARIVTEINFDIAVNVTESKESGGSGGVSVSSFSLAGKKSKNNKYENVSRIQFKVNAILPNTSTKSLNDK